MKSIIITGAASGIGEAVANLMLKDGWQVGMFDVNAQPLMALQKKWGKQLCHVQVVSVSDIDALTVAFKAFFDHAGKIDVLFNCAGILEFGHFEDISLERHHQILAVNNLGVMNGCHLAFPYLKNQESSRIINMSSASSLYGVPGLASYAASKAWVKSLTESLNIEWSRFGIHVMDVEPPFVNTNMVAGNDVRVMDKMGVSLSAQDIALKVKKSLTSSNIHLRVSFMYKLQYFFNAISIAPLRKLVMKYLTGY